MITPFRLGWPAIVSVARTSIAATLSFLIARLSGLPEAYWAAIMTLVIMQSTLGATLQISGLCPACAAASAVMPRLPAALLRDGTAPRAPRHGLREGACASRPIASQATSSRILN